MRKVALDLGTKFIAYCEVAHGQVVLRDSARTLDALQRRIGPNTPKAMVAFEACREAWHVHDKILSWGHVPVMLDTTRARQIGVGQHRRKTDRVDAEAMALALDAGRIVKAHVLSPARRWLRSQLQVREALVGTRAQYVTAVRGHCRANGIAIATGATETFLEKAHAAPIGEPLRALLAPLLAAIGVVDRQIAIADQQLIARVGDDPVIRALMTVPGVSVIAATAFVSVIDEAGRFRNVHALQSYLGLVPSESTTGGPEKRRVGSITKHGNGMLRALLVQAAHSMLNNAAADDPLANWGRALAAKRKGSLAAVALARRLAGVLWAIWRDGTVYDPADLAGHMAQGLTAAASVVAHRAAQLKKSARKIHIASVSANRISRRRAYNSPEVPTGI